MFESIAGLFAGMAESSFDMFGADNAAAGMDLGSFAPEANVSGDMFSAAEKTGMAEDFKTGFFNRGDIIVNDAQGNTDWGRTLATAAGAGTAAYARSMLARRRGGALANFAIQAMTGGGK